LSDLSYCGIYNNYLSDVSYSFIYFKILILYLSGACFNMKKYVV